MKSSIHYITILYIYVLFGKNIQYSPKIIHAQEVAQVVAQVVAQEVLGPQEHVSGKKKLNCAFNARSSKHKEFKMLSARRKKLPVLPQTPNNHKKFTVVGLTSNR